MVRIRVEFDREKLTEREAQLLEAMILLQQGAWGGVMNFLGQEQTEELATKYSQSIVDALMPVFPDLGLRVVRRRHTED